MQTKMTISAGAVVLLAVACAKQYVPAGTRLRDLTGVYDTAISLYSTTCVGVSTENARIRVDHTPGGLTLRLTYNLLPYDAKIDQAGNFTTPLSPFRDGNGQATAQITGKFTDSSFYARVRVTTPRHCDYQLRWSGVRL
jgi:hypothetical protein